MMLIFIAVVPVIFPSIPATVNIVIFKINQLTGSLLHAARQPSFIAQRVARFS
jgi:hypothetical protein